MYLATRLLTMLLCVASLAAAAHARQQSPQPNTPQPNTQRPGAQTPPPAQTTPEPTPPPATKKNARPASEAAAPSEPFERATAAQMSAQCVTLDTEAGAIVLEMLAEAAPESVRNFLNLAATGAFDTTTFSRVVRDFIIQGGNLTTREKVTPELLRRGARTVPDEPNAVKHTRGVLSMARPTEPDSATTHFFILLADAPHLDGTFAAFGRVRDGMDAVNKIAAGELDGEKPKSPVRVRHAAVAPCVPLP